MSEETKRAKPEDIARATEHLANGGTVLWKPGKKSIIVLKRPVPNLPVEEVSERLVGARV